jgi:hypothetical protein
VTGKLGELKLTIYDRAIFNELRSEKCIEWIQPASGPILLVLAIDSPDDLRRIANTLDDVGKWP